MKGVMKSAIFLMLFTLMSRQILHAQSKPNTLTQQEISDGWILLFDGETNFGWESHGGADWKIADGIISVSSGENGWLGTTSQFADYILKADYRTGADGNSGIFLRSASEGEPAKTGYELQICDTHKEYVTGSLVNYHKAQKKMSFAPDQWHSYEIRAAGDQFLINLDGKTLLKTRDQSHAVGQIGLQYNKGKKVEFRNIKLMPLGIKPIFNGKNLSGWQKVNSPDKKTVPVWSVRKKTIHVEGGPGQLEVAGPYGDFVLQLEIRTNPKDASHHPNSGVFFRGDPNVFWTGYESQIRNEFKNQDRTQPVDFGTGGIYHFQPTRRVIPNDGEYFSKTIIASGRHMAVWVNGIQVSDYTDTRPPGLDIYTQSRPGAGTISLQAHDPTTNLDFKNLKLASLPKR
jgi:hypothetical protein